MLMIRGFVNSYPKTQNIEKQICFEWACERIQAGIDQFIERISNGKTIHKNHFPEWKCHVMSSVNEKFYIFKNNLTCRSVKSIFSKHEVKNIMLSLKEYFVILPIYYKCDSSHLIFNHFDHSEFILFISN